MVYVINQNHNISVASNDINVSIQHKHFKIDCPWKTTKCLGSASDFFDLIYPCDNSSYQKSTCQKRYATGLMNGTY